MSRERKILVVACLVIAFVCNASDHNGVETDTIQTDTHIFEKIADDVYFATAAGTVHLVSNSLVVINELDEVEPTPPNVTFTDRLSIFRGSREIQLFHPGRGHTGGDVLVYLPKERVLFTGDLLYPWAPYLGDAFADEFPDTLEHLKELDIAVIAGGHGPLIKDTSIIDLAQSYLRSYWDQVSKFHSQGLTVAETLEALDLSDYEDFAVFQLNTPGVLELEVGRMYERLEEPR